MPSMYISNLLLKLLHYHFGLGVGGRCGDENGDS